MPAPPSSHGGDVVLVGAKADEMRRHAGRADREAGATDRGKAKTASASPLDGRAEAVTLSTAPYPGFATDMQAQFMAMAVLGTGASLLTETIFENRYMHVPELARMGCDIHRQRAVPRWCAASRASSAHR
jgi:UDP-N-acetylglucosamine 1-carboxyvinyltransferase